MELEKEEEAVEREQEIGEEEAVEEEDEIARLGCGSLCRGGSRSDGHEWNIIADPRSPFVDRRNPYFLDQHRNFSEFMLGKDVTSCGYELVSSTWAVVLLLGAAVCDWVGAYTIADFSSPDLSLILLVGIIVRVLFSTLYQYDVFMLLLKEAEFRILAVSSFLATLGLFDAFQYDIRCIWAVSFLMICFFAITTDASLKRTKKNSFVRLYVLNKLITYVNLTCVVILFYLGFVPRLRNRKFTVITKTTQVGNTTLVESSFEVNTLGTTLTLVQAILVYLLKEPYNNAKNQYAIIKLRLLASDSPALALAAAERMFSGVKDTMNQSNNMSSERMEETQEVDNMTALRRLPRQLTRGSSGTNVPPGEKRWRVSPVTNQLYNPAEPFVWDQKSTVGRQLFGEGFASFHFAIYHHPFWSKVIGTFGFVIIVLIFLTLTGVMDKSVAWVSLFAWLFAFMEVCDHNYVLLKRILATYEGKFMIAFAVLAVIGMCDVFLYDARCGEFYETSTVALPNLCCAVNALAIGVVVLSYIMFHEAKTRSYTPFAFDAYLTMCYVCLFVFILIFYLGLVTDIRNREVTPAEWLNRTSDLDIGTVEMTLYCWEFLLVLALKNWYLAIYKHGFAILKVNLKYTKEEAGNEFSTIFGNSGAISNILSFKWFRTRPKERYEFSGDISENLSGSMSANFRAMNVSTTEEELNTSTLV